MNNKYQRTLHFLRMSCESVYLEYDDMPSQSSSMMLLLLLLSSSLVGKKNRKLRVCAPTRFASLSVASPPRRHALPLDRPLPPPPPTSRYRTPACARGKIVVLGYAVPAVTSHSVCALARSSGARAFGRYCVATVLPPPPYPSGACTYVHFTPETAFYIETVRYWCACGPPSTGCRQPLALPAKF